MHVIEEKEEEEKTICHRVSLLSWCLKYLTCYGAQFSDWGSAAVKYMGKKTQGVKDILISKQTTVNKII